VTYQQAKDIKALIDSGEYLDGLKCDICRTYSINEYIVILTTDHARFALLNLDDWTMYYHALMTA